MKKTNLYKAAKYDSVLSNPFSLAEEKNLKAPLPKGPKAMACMKVDTVIPRASSPY